MRDALVSNQDWEQAGHSYAAAHDAFYEINHTFEVWTSHLLMDPKSRDLRSRVVPKMKLGTPLDTSMRFTSAPTGLSTSSHASISS